MPKDFDSWNLIKKMTDEKYISRDFFFHEREVWWCSLGINIGVESDGKNYYFERPVLIVKKFNADMIWIIPLTSRRHDSEYYTKVYHEFGPSWACLTQLRVVSTKRLLRKIGMTIQTDFEVVLNSLSSFIKIETPAVSGGISEAEATNETSLAP